jgi:hypothetical protein
MATMKKYALAAAVLVGLGLAGCSQETKDNASETAQSVGTDVQNATDAAGSAVEDAAKDAGAVADKAADKATHAADKAADKAATAVDKLGDKIDQKAADAKAAIQDKTKTN